MVSLKTGMALVHAWVRDHGPSAGFMIAYHRKVYDITLVVPHGDGRSLVGNARHTSFLVAVQAAIQAFDSRAEVEKE